MLALGILLCSTSAHGQQGGEQLAAEVARVRQEIKELERATVPAGRAAGHRGLVEDKRIRLHGLLQQQRDELSSYRDLLVRTRAAPSEVRDVERDIETKERELQDLKGTLRAGLSGVPPAPALPQPAERSAPQPDPIPNPAVRPPRDGAVPRPQPAPPGRNIEPSEAVSALTSAEAVGGNELNPCSLLEDTARQGELSQYERAVCKVVARIRQEKLGEMSADPTFPSIPGNPQATFALDLEPDATQVILAAKLIGTEERAKFLLEAEEARTDKQVGGGPASAGSTTLVVKGGAPTVLGFAVENGALVQSRSGTTVTFRGNPVGISKFLSGKAWDDSYLEDENEPVVRQLKKISFGVSFDTDRGTEPGTFTADRQQLSAYSFRYEFINERDPRHRKHQAAWARFVAGQGVDLAQAIAGSYYQVLTFIPPEEDVTSGQPRPSTSRQFRDPALQGWLEETRRLISAATPGEVETVFKSQVAKIPNGDQVTDETRLGLRNFSDGLRAYLQAREKLLDEVAKGSVITFEYTNRREVNAPDLSNFRFIAEKGVFGGKADLTANASLTVFNSRPAAGMKRVRDFQFAAQLDAPFKVRDLGDFVFSFAGRYERVRENAVALDGTVLPGVKGDIGVGQLKLIVPLRGTGIQFPISVTFANRTELVREKEVRGNFGFTFDLDKLLARYLAF